MLVFLLISLSFGIVSAQNIPMSEASQIIRDRLLNSPNDCNTLLSPIKAGNPLSLNSSRELRQETLSQVIDQANEKCLRTLAQNLSLSTNDQDREQLIAIIEKLSANTAFGFEPVEMMCSPLPSGIEEVLRLAKESKRVTSCKPNAVGEIKVIDEYRSPSGISAEYSLMQTASNAWTASIALDVKSAEGLRGSDMFERIKGCINAASPYFKGENGRKLDVVILSPAERQSLPSNKRPPLVDIAIQPVDARSNSAAYAADISCSTIVHEVLHILGLCDEYDGKGDGYECRSVPSSPSIMKSHTQVFKKAVPRQASCECSKPECTKFVEEKNMTALKLMGLAWEVDPLDYEFRNKYCTTSAGGYVEALDPNIKNSITIKTSENFEINTFQLLHQGSAKMFKVKVSCRCPAGDANCTRLRDTASEQYQNQKLVNCPYGTKEVMSHFGKPGKFAITANGFNLPVTGDANSSLLLPAHFDRIVGGACDDVVPEYNQCAQWAYKGSSNGNNCAGRPSYCTSDNWWK